MIIIIINMLFIGNVTNYANSYENSELVKPGKPTVDTNEDVWVQKKHENGELFEMYVTIHQKLDEENHRNIQSYYKKYENETTLFLNVQDFNTAVFNAFKKYNYSAKLSEIKNRRVELTNDKIEEIKEKLDNGGNEFKLYYDYGSGLYKDWIEYVNQRYQTILKGQSGVGDITQDVDYWKPGQSGDNTKINNIANIVLSLIRTIGIFVALGSLMVLGIKYMLGSLEEKAHYKQTMIPWIIGAIMVFAVTSLPKLIYDLAQNI